MLTNPLPKLTEQERKAFAYHVCKNAALPTTPGGFHVVYADPSWNYKDSASAGKRGAVHKYAILSTADICALPVASVCAPDAVLFLWATPPTIADAFRVIDAWGFKYKTFGFTWAKRNKVANTPFFGMGNWTRANLEPCLLATRGKPKRASAAVPQFLWSPKLRHSEKPALVRDRIVALMGDVPRLELFSRHLVPGWHRWGNEVLP